MPGGRPRKVRSQRLDGVGGQSLSWSQMRKLLQLGEHYRLDREDRLTRWDYLERIWLAFGTYQATDQALRKQVGSVDQMFDRDTVVQRCQAVAELLESRADLVQPSKCIAEAHLLAESLRAFPVDLRAQAAWLDDQFMGAKLALEFNAVRVALWADHRVKYLALLQRIVSVCGRLERPKTRTKPTLMARHELAQRLADIYLQMLHPDRMAAWSEYRIAHSDERFPPPPESTEAFGLGVMSILDIPFESKGVSD